MKSETRKLYCCECNGKTEARLTDGTEIYPHRNDLAKLPFWICDTCKNYVGCHHKTANPTEPLGCIATEEIKNARKHIHAILDPLWKRGKYKRGQLYKIISDRIGWRYHTAQIRTIEEARAAYRIIKELSK